MSLRKAWPLSLLMVAGTFAAVVAAIWVALLAFGVLLGSLFLFIVIGFLIAAGFASWFATPLLAHQRGRRWWLWCIVGLFLTFWAFTAALLAKPIRPQQ